MVQGVGLRGLGVERGLGAGDLPLASQPLHVRPQARPPITAAAPGTEGAVRGQRGGVDGRRHGLHHPPALQVPRGPLRWGVPRHPLRSMGVGNDRATGALRGPAGDTGVLAVQVYAAVFLPLSLRSRESIRCSLHCKVCTVCVRLALSLTEHRKRRKPSATKCGQSTGMEE